MNQDKQEAFTVLKTIIFLFLFLSNVWSEDIVAEEWPTETIRTIARSREKLSQSLFDILDDVTLANIKIANGSLEISSGRKVYENHDVAGSWTVMDHVNIDLSNPLFSTKNYMLNNISTLFRSDLIFGLRFTDIRQVQPNKHINKSIILNNIDSATSSPPPEYKEQIFDGITEARYGKIWNTTAFPCRTPFKSEWFSRMEDKEIIIWNTYGTIEMGPNIGCNIDPTGIINPMQAGISFRIYLHGSYQISVLREDSKHARVKVSKKGTNGNKFGASVGSEPLAIGFMLVTVKPNWLAITPFSFSLSKELANVFDATYRYDLTKESGKTAFSAAIKGQFGLSDQLAGGIKWKESPLNSPVYKIGNRNTNSENIAESSSVKYMLLFRHGHNTTVTSSNIIITLPNKTVHEFNSLAENNRYVKWISGDSLNIDYNFKVSVDLDQYKQKDKNAIYLILTGEINNSDTSGKEIIKYCSELENAVNRPNFFTRPPIFKPLPTIRPSPNDEFDRRLQYEGPVKESLFYGQSSFFYQITYNQEQLLRFINTPKENMWKFLEQAFMVPDKEWSSSGSRAIYNIINTPFTLINLPGYIVNLHIRNGDILCAANQIRNAWIDAQEEQEITSKITKIGKIFSDRFYGRELARLLHICLSGEKVTYIIQVNSHVFGMKREEGIGINVNIKKEEVNFDFDVKGTKVSIDPQATITTLNVKKINNNWSIQFEINNKPIGIFIRIIQHKPWRLPHILGEMVLMKDIINFKNGNNIINVEIDKESIGKLFSQIINNGSRYDIQIACTCDGVNWGGIREQKLLEYSKSN